MSSRNLAWGLGGMVLLTFAGGCGGSLNEVGKDMGGTGGDSGDDGGTAGSSQHDGGSGSHLAGTSSGGSNEGGGYGGSGHFGGFAGTGHAGDEPGGYGGSGFGGYATGGSGFGGYDFGGYDFGGYAGTGFSGYAGTGSAGGPPTCFDAFETYGPDSQLDLAPQNTVLLDVHPAQTPPMNSASQLLFPTTFTGQWEAYANFPGVGAELAANANLSLPDDLASLPDNLAQFYITRRNCAGNVVAGRSLLVEVWWKSGVTTPPTHGLALGVYDKQKKLTEWLPDTTRSFIVGDASNKKLTDTLNRIQLKHTFAATDDTDARSIVIGAWLASEQVQPTSFYVGNVHWD